MCSADEIEVGVAVEKVSGYQWPGIVVAVFYTLEGQRRYVVECTVPEVAGALHIYSGQQIRRRPEPSVKGRLNGAG